MMSSFPLLKIPFIPNIVTICLINKSIVIVAGGENLPKLCKLPP